MRFLNFACGVATLGVALGAAGPQAGAAQRAGVPAQKTVLAPATPQAGCFVTPATNSDRPFHTNYLLASVNCSAPLVAKQPGALRTQGPMVMIQEDGGAVPTSTFEEAETPQSVGCLYVQSPNSPGCVPNYASGSGGPVAKGYGAIVIVDAYDNPDAATDLSTFDTYWGIAAPPSFTKVYANGNGDCTTPPPNSGWALEESLDIEYSHVMASKAAIVLVEACSNSFTDLYYAEQVAFGYLVSNYPKIGGQVSNSWAGQEFSGETAYDEDFAGWAYSTTTPIQAFASAGDSGYLNGNGTNNVPSVIPWLVSAGGTSILRLTTNDHYSSESCWGGSGGGPSTYETYATTFTGANTGPWADFQYPIFGQSVRFTPDMSFDADPASGVWIYSLYGAGGWVVVGGTSVASPSLAGIVNRAGNKLGGVLGTGGPWYTASENNLIYSQLPTATAYKANFNDVKTGSNGSAAGVGYDQCTGVGSPRGLLGK